MVFWFCFLTYNVVFVNVLIYLKKLKLNDNETKLHTTVNTPRSTHQF